MSRLFRITCLWCLVPVLAGCASTRLTSVWSDPSASGTKLTSVMALVISKDEVTRRIGEDTLAQALQPTKAVAAYRVLSDGGLRDKDRSKQALKAIVVTSLKVQGFVP